MADRLLVLGNKKYSSWSLRGWIGLAMAEVPFTERIVKLHRPETPREIAAISPAGRVPVLVEPDGLMVHDSLAILEHINETYADGRMLPADHGLRARARAVSAEMHAGFPHLRERLPMNLGRAPAPLSPAWAIDAPTAGEIARILTLWEELLGECGGPFLFGAWSIADCMYLPVATRFRTYAVDLSAYPRSAAYAERLLTLPAFRRWEADGRAEPEEMPEYAR